MWLVIKWINYRTKNQRLLFIQKPDRNLCVGHLEQLSLKVSKCDRVLIIKWLHINLLHISYNKPAYKYRIPYNDRSWLWSTGTVYTVYITVHRYILHGIPRRPTTFPKNMQIKQNTMHQLNYEMCLYSHKYKSIPIVHSFLLVQLSIFYLPHPIYILYCIFHYFFAIL